MIFTNERLGDNFAFDIPIRGNKMITILDMHVLNVHPIDLHLGVHVGHVVNLDHVTANANACTGREVLGTLSVRAAASLSSHRPLSSGVAQGVLLLDSERAMVHRATPPLSHNLLHISHTLSYNYSPI